METSPKGKLLVIGGAVVKGTVDDTILPETNSDLKFFEIGILSRFLSEMKGKTHRVELVTTASEIPEEIAKQYIDAFNRLNNTNVGVIDIRTREDAIHDKYYDQLVAAEGILFTGGNQLRLTSIFGGTKILDMLIERYQKEKVIIAGTSAGAMAMSNTMIYQGSSSEALRMGAVKLCRGFGFIRDVIFDSHFVKRGRFGRLFQAVASNPSCIGIGLGENTGLLIKDGVHMEAVGTGLVVIVDGRTISYTNIASLNDGEPVSIENLSIHILAKGNGYILSERKFLQTL